MSGTARWGGIRLIIAVAALSLLASAQAAAQTGFACDRYANVLTSQELQSAVGRVRLLLPAEYAPALASLRVLNSDDSEQLGPSWEREVGGASLGITVPPGFRRLQCQLMQLQFYQMNGHPVPGISAAISQCIRQGGGKRRCLESEVRARVQEVERRSPFDEDNLSRLYGLVENGFLHVLLHEAAHYLIDRGLAGTIADEEVSADVMAYLALSTEGSPSISSLATFAALSVLDSEVNWSDEEHPSSGCRALITDKIVKEVAPEITLAFMAALDLRRYEEMRRAPRWKDILSLQIAGTPAGCPAIDPAPITLLRADAETLLRTLDLAIGANNDPQKLLQVLNQLLLLPMRTPEGGRLKGSVASLFLLSGLTKELNDSMDGPQDERAQAGARWVGVVNRFEPRGMNAGTYGRIVRYRVMLEMMTTPPHGRAERVMRAFRRLIDESQYYIGDDAITAVYRGGVAMYEGRCTEAVRWVELGSSAEDPMRLGANPYEEMDPEGLEELARRVRSPGGCQELRSRWIKALETDFSQPPED
jgi:hypothetical protein